MQFRSIVFADEQKPKIVLRRVQQLADGLEVQILAAQVIPASDIQLDNMQVANVVWNSKVSKRGFQDIGGHGSMRRLGADRPAPS